MRDVLLSQSNGDKLNIKEWMCSSVFLDSDVLIARSLVLSNMQPTGTEGGPPGVGTPVVTLQSFVRFDIAMRGPQENQLVYQDSTSDQWIILV